MSILVSSFPYLMKAAVTTLWLSVLCIVLGTVVGTAVGIVGVRGPKVLRSVVTTYVFVVRGIPVLVLMFMAYFSLPMVGVNVDAFVAVAGALVLYVAAFVAEITRGAILSIPRAQIDAAKSLGMRSALILRLIILPQAFRMSVPPLLNNSVMTVKTTSYASIVGVWEVSFAAREIAERTLAVFPILLAVMLIYFVICYPLSLLATHLERRFTYAH